MRKITLTDNSGRWFDWDSAKQWGNRTIKADDGTPISRVTGNSWEHETLFLTTKGTFVLACRNEHNPSLDTFTEMEVGEAIKWLMANGYADDVEKLDYRKEAAGFEC